MATKSEKDTPGDTIDPILNVPEAVSHKIQARIMPAMLPATNLVRSMTRNCMTKSHCRMSRGEAQWHGTEFCE